MLAATRLKSTVSFAMVYLVAAVLVSPFAIIAALATPYLFFSRKDLEERGQHFLDNIQTLSNFDLFFVYADHPIPKIKAEARNRNIPVWFLEVTALAIILPFTLWPKVIDGLGLNDEVDDTYFFSDWLLGLGSWCICGAIGYMIYFLFF